MDNTSLNTNNTSLPICAEIPEETSNKSVEFVIYSIILPIISLIGILGNILNLAVLTHRSWRKQGRLERYVNSGLVALATADMFVCICILPWGLFPHFRDPHNKPPDRITFQLVFERFSSYFINTFMIASTLFTTSLAIGRYLAIMWPLEMRARINSKLTRTVIIGVLFASFTFNLPRFWIFKIETCEINGKQYYQKSPGPLHSDNNKQLFIIYTCLYFTIAIAIPLIVLAFCNFFLLKHINKAQDRQISACYNTASATLLRKRQEDTSRLMTLVLAILVIMHIVLVTPAELGTFLMKIANFSSSHEKTTNIVVAVVNLLESINFSFNFVLYCILNIHFRNIIKASFLKCCKVSGKDKTNNNDDFLAGDRMDSLTEHSTLYVDHKTNHTFIGKTAL